MKNYFSGPFSDLLNEFVQFKRNTGFKYEKESHYLKQFSEFTLSQGITDPVLSKNLAEAWCNKKPFENQRNCTEQRISCLRQFALYLGSLGYCFLQVLFAESCKLKIQNVALWKIHSFAS
ncbi:hypothetical protein [Acetobacterium wieringae]|uniref:Core-binding (CB) domain-containing protein n=1 Tax=Acetobacterium wieringae TaxID=52694 RepID=A0A1F2PCV1_9FIRM|nr:hypothetical protein [Acetobacterium wieringae]OFV69073.1 hypothetical protein ACWI_34690 [Acetobacterium wieringae]